MFENPVMEYCKYIIFEKFLTFEVQRPEKYGGNVAYESYDELTVAYEQGTLSPVDLKLAVIGYLDQLIAPVRNHFETDPKAKALADFVKREQKKQKARENAK